MQLLQLIVKRMQALEDAYRVKFERLEARLTSTEVAAARMATSVMERGDLPDGNRMAGIEATIGSMDARLGVIERRIEALRERLVSHEQEPRPTDHRVDGLVQRVIALETQPTDEPVVMHDMPSAEEMNAAEERVAALVARANMLDEKFTMLEGLRSLLAKGASDDMTARLDQIDRQIATLFTLQRIDAPNAEPPSALVQLD